MTNNLFETVLTFPDPVALDVYNSLFGLDDVKQRLEKEAESMLRPDLFEKWSRDKHGTRLALLDTLQRRPPLFIFAGDVGTGKTALASSFGDSLARATNVKVHFYCLSLRARGSGAVGEMTRLISDAFSQLRQNCHKVVTGKKPTSATILLIDEADSLAQSREFAQMHHEDRAGVNALIRGIDDIAANRLPCLVVMCTNRLTALDPAVKRRAAGIFEFVRPDLATRQFLLGKQLEGAGLSDPDLHAIAEALGERDAKDYGHTYSDITQRFIPTLVLAAYPKDKITRKLALEVIKLVPPTPPFNSERTAQ